MNGRSIMHFRTAWQTEIRVRRAFLREEINAILFGREG